MQSDPNPVIPIFHPIFSVEDTSIIAYEALDSSAEKRENLFRSFSEVKEKASLFLPISPDLLLAEVEKARGLDFSLLSELEKFRIEPNKVFLEISERTCVRGIEALATSVELFRHVGFKIALNDLGSESSNLERLGALKPDIIKVDMNWLSRSIQYEQSQSILEYLKNISLGLGSELLFEGIESEEALYRAVDAGARYLQGNLFGNPDPYFIQTETSINFLQPFLDAYHKEKRKQISKEIHFELEIREVLDALVIPTSKVEKRVLLDAFSIFKLSTAIRRVYVTDWDGTQVSPYYEKDGISGFKENTQNLQKNWSYLPFFYKHVKEAFRNPNAWQMSEPYFDRALGERLIVFSKILQGQLSIFIDVSYKVS